ncbi:hypothetical protein PV10_07133 [Exophiala mesophila]|uniref:Uncharacterized protein n=1 Tax=Exophiala mesophila TaxID=212818 RepID=A0A0D1ZSF6_EXOME|nr:uncharacterized protein PV10_07133 [Exophiala mesophila]KIV89753.1 hypothetical protein PV10_07133 [Exophiala mesophila]
MPFHDLNLLYTSNHDELHNTLAFEAELGYTIVALSLSVTGKLPSTPQLLPISSLTVPKSITKLLSRITITISDATQNHRLSSLLPHYDLVALRPTNEKALQLCCGSLECDLISIDFSQRLPFILKFKTVASALQRGIRFEICYSPGIGGGSGGPGSDARRNLISGATALIRATRGRGIILSSEARNALRLRGPYDVTNLAQLWGLGQERGKEAICEEANKVVRLAKIKRTSFRGVVDIVDGGRREEKPQSKNVAASSQIPAWGTSGGMNTTSDRRDGQKGPAPAASSGGTNGVKRKASVSLPTPMTSVTVQDEGDDKPISKREQKRRAKRAKLESRESAKAGKAEKVDGA